RPPGVEGDPRHGRHLRSPRPRPLPDLRHPRRGIRAEERNRVHDLPLTPSEPRGRRSEDPLLPPATLSPFRVVIENVTPEVDAGRYAVKRVVGETVLVEADVFTDGHDAISGVLQHGRLGESDWTETPLRPLGNDRWQAGFAVTELARYGYRLCVWVDRIKIVARDLANTLEAGMTMEVGLLGGVERVADK